MSQKFSIQISVTVEVEGSSSGMSTGPTPQVKDANKNIFNYLFDHYGIFILIISIINHFLPSDRRLSDVAHHDLNMSIRHLLWMMMQLGQITQAIGRRDRKSNRLN